MTRRDQGFFRYSVSRDWKVPHYEKMLLTNAGLATACLEADQATGRGHYREARRLGSHRLSVPGVVRP